MKTQVIQIDPNDDVTSVRDRISWARARRILLVFPPDPGNLRHPLNLRLLQRHALVQGVQIAIVSKSPVFRRQLVELGIPVYKSTTYAQSRVWSSLSLSENLSRNKPRPDLRQMQREAVPVDGRWRNLRWVRLLSFSLAVIGVFILLILIFPSASIEIDPQTHDQSLNLTMYASPSVDGITPNGYLPAHVASTTVELSKTIPTTGSEQVPDTAASGTVQFSNLTTSPVSIPVGTIVSTTGDSPVRYATTEQVLVPAGVGETQDVPVRAVDKGSVGNQPSDSIVAIEGELGPSLAVTNPEQTIGGSDRFAPVQTAKDRNQIKSTLTEEILQECNKRIPQTLESGDVYFPDTLAVSRTLSELYFPAENQTGDTLSLTLDMECQAQYASGSDLEKFAGLELNAVLPTGYMPVSGTVTNSISAVPVTAPNGVSHWEVKAGQKLTPDLHASQVMHLILGRSSQRASQLLSNAIQLTAPPIIKITPSWWPWLPFIPFRINLKSGE